MIFLVWWVWSKENHFYLQQRHVYIVTTGSHVMLSVLLKGTACWPSEAEMETPIDNHSVSWATADSLRSGDEIVHKGSESSLTMTCIYFDLRFMRTVKACQVQQESISDKPHLLPVNSSVRQTDVISLLICLCSLHDQSYGYIWKLITCRTTYLKDMRPRW